MIKNQSKNYLVDYIDSLQSEGRYSFQLTQLQSYFSNSLEALKKALNKLSKKGKVISLRKGFYVIVPPEYRVGGTLPPLRFIDDMMEAFHKPYYVGLLSAAALHGSSHQQSQLFFVATMKPQYRNIRTRNLSIQFYTTTHIPELLIEKMKIDTGYVRVSNSALTAADIVRFSDRVGGLNIAVTVLEELTEKMSPNDVAKLSKCRIPISTIQRLGFILEYVINQQKLANSVFKILELAPYYPILLSPQHPKEESPKIKGDKTSNNRWKVLQNIELESDL